MILSNIKLGVDVNIDPSSSINNIEIGDRVKISKRCSLFGSSKTPIFIGDDTYIGMNCILNGYAAQIIIGTNVSFAQNVNVMTDSGPNASILLQKIFPIQSGEVRIGDHSWIGASTIIMPNVNIGKLCIIAANSFVNKSFPDYSIIGGTPAKLIRKLDKKEINQINCVEP
ncbi:MAG: acyltransferase [Bacteroidales bacterium]|nr:acyltransferase [Bacteroidales bacterium]